MNGRRLSDCRFFEAIEERLAEGAVPTAEELRFREEHMAVCAACRSLVRVEELLAYRDPADGPVEPLDEISLRRQVADILAIVDDVGPLPETDDEVEVHPLRRRWLALGGLAAALAATLAVVALWPIVRRTPSKHPGARRRGRLLFRAGRVNLSSDGALVGSGGRLSVQAGRAGLELPCQAGLVAFDDTDVRLDRLAERACELFLTKGRIFVAVKHLDPPVRFVVHTQAGTASVRGTAFSVVSDGRRIGVSVLRGLVAVDDGNDGIHVVAAGHGYDSGRGAQALGSQELERLAAADSGLRLALGTGKRGTLSLRSKPDGAFVTIDGMEFGSCPLEVEIQSGLHVLRLSWTDGSTQRLTVDVPVGGLVSKTVRAPQRAGPMRRRDLAGAAEVPRTRDDVAVKTRRSSEKRSAGGRGEVDRLMAEARKFRAQGRWREAASRYARIADGYRGRAVAATAQVLLGWMLLRHLGRPAQALRRFDAYLAHGGPLAQEAAYGKILALRHLGRKDRERLAIQAFLKRYSKAIQVPALKRRLQDISVHRNHEVRP